MTIDAQVRTEPKATLQNMEVHSDWIRRYRSRENDRFYQLAFDYLASVFGEPGNSPIVDAGCGTGQKSRHLAQRGYRVRGLDFSHVIVEEARNTVRIEGLQSQIEFEQGDLTALTLPSGSVERAMCWGVLMHVPDITKAVSELARIIKPGGTLVISEGNFRSVQARTLRFIKFLVGRGRRHETLNTPAGIETWEKTSTGRLMTRQADIPWMIAEFGRHGLELQARRAGQFTEIYTVLKPDWMKPLRMLVHAFNNFWFRFIRSGGPSFGNLLVFKRPK
jgi:2-polyprenyl-3-methyl-5-hydroxy-6-metoxy-1,4-benzoquinol methylase